MFKYKSNTLKLKPIHAAIALIISTNAQAATFTVTNLDDSGPGSLRQAVLDANASLAANTIAFQAGLTGTITLTSGEIAITGRMTINGPGETVLAVSGNNASRVFNVTGAASTIQGLTIKSGIFCGDGGGIFNRSSITLNHITLSGNRSVYGYPFCGGTGGGGIYNTGSLTANYLTLANNLSDGVGAGIFNSGSLTINNSIFVGNNATNYGGAIYNDGTVMLINSTLSGNIARQNGGGINNNGDKTLTIINSTIAENVAVVAGGGIYNNRSVTVSNSIVAGNSAPVAKNIQNNANFTSRGANLFGENGASGVTGFTLMPNDLVLAGAINTAIIDLDDNGGPTFTYTLAADSPAIDAGDNSLIPAGITTDQRGDDFPRIIGTNVDIGAVEYGNAGTAYALTITKTGSGSGTVTSNPTGINCGSVCSYNFVEGTSPTLTATPAAGSAFIGWSNNICTGTGLCNLDMYDTDQNITATFISQPVVSTNAPSVITSTSVKLNGNVNPKGSATTVTFDFGTTTIYGTSIAATPGTIAATAAATVVTADKTGLACNTLYHYRVKAVNSAGTRYGADRTFTTSDAVCKPDFVITGLTMTPVAPVTGANFTVAVTVKNQDRLPSDGGQLRLWLNQSAAQTCAASGGDKTLEIGTIAAGESKVVTFTGLNLATAGTKTLRALVDATCTTVESNETNNQLTKSYRITGIRQADLLVTSVILTPITPAVNSTFTAKITVTNQGKAISSSAFIDLFANQPTAVACATEGDAWVEVSNLAAGASQTLTVTLPEVATAGTKMLRAFVDSWCEVTESNEANNQFTQTYTVQ